MAKLTVVKTELANFNSTIELRDAMRADNIKQFWPRPYPSENETPEKWVARLIECETQPAVGLVEETMLWGLVDGVVVGRLGLRHRLNENLKMYGGHIGYEVHPLYRRKGYATEMLRQTLLTPHAKKIGRILLTCAPDNAASNKTILANGGELEKTAHVDFLGEDRNYYWIDLDRS